MAELSLWLDSYDDIYSDFDSRRYHKRRISEDFVDELKAALKYRPEHPDAMILLLPAKDRDANVENEIVSSLKTQLDQRQRNWNAKAGSIRRRGFIMLLSGVLVMVADSIIAYKAQPDYLTGLVRIIMEPAGWFLTWSGLDFLLYEYRALRKENSIYKTIAQLSIHFKDA
jgi:hypothetical protein